MKDEKLILKPKRAKGDDGYKVFSIRIKEDLVARMDNIAFETGYSRNELVGKFIEYSLDRCIIDKTD